MTVRDDVIKDCKEPSEAVYLNQLDVIEMAAHFGLLFGEDLEQARNEFVDYSVGHS